MFLASEAVSRYGNPMRSLLLVYCWKDTFPPGNAPPWAIATVKSQQLVLCGKPYEGRESALALLYLWLQDKTYYPAVEEQKRVIAQHGRTISFEALNDMPVLHRNIQEAIRLHPPLILLLRQVHKDFTVTTSKGKSYRIPKVGAPFSLEYYYLLDLCVQIVEVRLSACWACHWGCTCQCLCSDRREQCRKLLKWQLSMSGIPTFCSVFSWLQWHVRKAVFDLGESNLRATSMHSGTHSSHLSSICPPLAYGLRTARWVSARQVHLQPSEQWSKSWLDM